MRRTRGRQAQPSEALLHGLLSRWKHVYVVSRLALILENSCPLPSPPSGRRLCHRPVHPITSCSQRAGPAVGGTHFSSWRAACGWHESGGDTRAPGPVIPLRELCLQKRATGRPVELAELLAKPALWWHPGNGLLRVPDNNVTLSLLTRVVPAPGLFM